MRFVGDGGCSAGQKVGVVRGICVVGRPLVRRGVSVLEGGGAKAGRFHGLMRRVKVLVKCRTLQSLPMRGMRMRAPVRAYVAPVVSKGGLTIVPILQTNLKVMGDVLALIPSTGMNRMKLCHSPMARRPRRCCYGLPRTVSRQVSIVMSPVLTANNSTRTTISFIGGRNKGGVGFVYVVTTPRKLEHLRRTRPSIRVCYKRLSHRLGSRTCVYPNLKSTKSHVFKAVWRRHSLLRLVPVLHV